jgi:hypothetical protein
MFGLFKKFLYDPNKETIEIFEKKTKIEYDSELFLSLKVLSLTHTPLRNLAPLSVFTNVEILNLAHNKITNIDSLESMEDLKIVDLRFNQIRDLPAWVYTLGKPLYWSRKDEREEGIYLEGNPLSENLILEIKNSNSPLLKKEKLLASPLKKEEPIKDLVDTLYPLNTQHIALFTPKENHSKFVKETILKGLLIEPSQTNIRVNISVIEYDKDDNILNFNRREFKNLSYMILILKDRECCLHPKLLETLLDFYPSSKIFLIIEGSQDNIDEKIKFFKTYTQSKNILDVFHSFDSKSNEEIKNKIFTYLETTKEVNSLWQKSWIALKKTIERTESQKLTFSEFQILADSHLVQKEMREYLFAYLQKVGSVKK